MIPCKYLLLILFSLFVYHNLSDEIKHQNYDHHFEELIDIVKNNPSDYLWIPAISLILWIVC